MPDFDDGGPAFPADSYACNDGIDRPRGISGMSLRDYFATKALTGLLASKDEAGDWQAMQMRETDYSGYCRLWAESAYDMADAMLKARKEPQ